MTTSFKVRINLNCLRFLPLHSRGRSRIDSHSGYQYPVLVPKPRLFIKNFDWIKNPTRRKQAEEAHQLFVKNFNSIEKGHIFARQYHDLIDEISIEQAAQEDLSSTDIDYQEPREYPDWG